MRKPIPAILYLVLCTLAIFYVPKIISALGRTGEKSPAALAADAHTTESAYYALREVASVQLDHILITYDIDESSGRYLARYRNRACANLQGDPEILKKQMAALQDELHERILLLAPGADADNSGFVTTEEGDRFRDLFEFGHLAAHCRQNGVTDTGDLARAAGLDPAGAARNLHDLRELVAAYPPDISILFPAVGD